MNYHDLLVKRLKSKREALGFDIERLSKLTSVKESLIIQYESNSAKVIYLDDIERIADQLEVSPSWLCGFDKNR